MTTEQFIEWLDEKIEQAERKCDAATDIWDVHGWRGTLIAFQDVREKFVTLIPPPTTLS